ncbi:hydrogenase [Mycobacterium sp. SM1]|uniref:proton-conducting transporter transmembrane domain-containing protein n=1 Tax=Mycobacterium sp. SM1 TaxID=2816243 RepID=UPI001BCEF8D0|nr:proton-conducting transporter membrane subunit [Mycobacterium sp. SM1]MBS4729641.1 hydrogenase [Mycobacterium sp. SM1]
MTILVLAPIVLPALAGLAYAAIGWQRRTAWLGVLAASGALASGIALAIVVTRTQPRTGLGGLLRADALSAYMLIVIGAIAVLAMAASPAYLAGELASGHTDAGAARRYGILTQAFIATMNTAVLAASLGVLWAAIEATTILTAFLVGHRHTRGSVEAAWKYVVVCSVGIALAFLGIVLLNYAAVHTGLPPAHAMDWTSLTANAHALDPGVTRIAVAVLVLGFGTKTGLAPMHAWLPDAHSQAPAPVSALMSGVLLSVAFYAILRVKVISDATLGGGFARSLLLIVALTSITLAAALLVAQRDYKRMLAYHSIEHMGLIALGAAAGSQLAIAAVLLHILGHGLAKAVLFLSSGHLHQALGSSQIHAVRDLAGRAPLLAGTLGVGLLALLGLPPFSLFASELGMFRAGFAAGLGWAVSLALASMLVIFAAVAAHAGDMLLGSHDQPAAPAATAVSLRLPGTAATALIAGLGACAVLGITAWPLRALLHAAALAVGGT